nr:MAG TPA: hypothetical protein [Bacteriophage sp.]
MHSKVRTLFWEKLKNYWTKQSTLYMMWEGMMVKRRLRKFCQGYKE